VASYFFNFLKAKRRKINQAIIDPMSESKKILIRLPNWIGDIVMALPMIEALKKTYPCSQIDVLVRFPFDSLLAAQPHIRKIIPLILPKVWHAKLNHGPLIKGLKQEHYDTAIVCTHSFSSAWMMKQAGIPHRIGSRRFLGNWLLSHSVQIDRSLHQKKQYLQLLDPLKIPYEESWPKLHIDPQHVEPTKAKFSCLGLDFSQPYVLLHPGASYGAAKTWPMEHFETLASKLLLETDCQVVILGEKPNRPFKLQNARFFDFSSQTTLVELMVLIQHGSYLICNDSGPMHLGYALGIPLIALFGATDPLKTGPSGALSDYLFNKTDCGPCFKRVCPLDHRCMKNLSPDQVFKKLQTKLPVHGSS